MEINQNMETVQFTRQERNKVYKKALENFAIEINGEEEPRISLCGYIKRAMIDLDLPYISEVEPILDAFPEFEAYMPENLSPYIFWWADDKIAIRIEVLKDCIEQTK